MIEFPKQTSYYLNEFPTPQHSAAKVHYSHISTDKSELNFTLIANHM